MKSMIVLLFVLLNVFVARCQDGRVTSIKPTVDTLPNGKVIRRLMLDLKNVEPDIKIIMIRILETEISYKDKSMPKRDTSERRWFDLSIPIKDFDDVKNISSIKGKVEIVYSNTTSREKVNADKKQTGQATSVIDFDLPVVN